MSLRFDDSFINREGSLDIEQLYIKHDAEGAQVCYGEIPEGILLRGEKLQELLEAAANNTEFTDKQFAFVVRDPKIKKLARNILGLEKPEHQVQRNKVFSAFQRAVKRAKKIGKGLVKIQKTGYRGKTLGEHYWRSEISASTDGVTMLSEKERESFCLNCEDGIFTRKGAPYSTDHHYSCHSGKGYAIFVVGPNKQMYCHDHLTHSDEGKLFYHSSFLSDGAIFCAGEIKIDEHGKLVALSNKSGHYQPGDPENLFLLRYLEERGIDLTTVEFSFVGGSSKVRASDYYDILKIFVKENSSSLEKNVALRLMSLGIDLKGLEPAWRSEVIQEVVGIVNLLEEGVKLEQLQSLKPPEWRSEVIKNGASIKWLLRGGVTFDQLQALGSQEWRTEIINNAYGIGALIEKGVTLKELTELIPPEWREEVVKNSYNMAKLLSKTNSLKQLHNLNPDFRGEIIRKAGDVAQLLVAGATLKDLTDLEPVFQLEVMDNIISTAYLLMGGKGLNQLQDLRPLSWRKEVLSNGYDIYFLLTTGVSLDKLQSLESGLRTEVLHNGRNLMGLLKREGMLEQLGALDPEFRVVVMQQAWGVKTLLDEGVALMRLQGLEPIFRAQLIAFPDQFVNLSKAGVTLEYLERMDSSALRSNLINNAHKVLRLLKKGITLEWLVWLSPERRNEIIENPGGWKAAGWSLLTKVHSVVGKRSL
jgi:hypothetical protein